MDKSSMNMKGGGIHALMRRMRGCMQRNAP